MLEFNQKLRNFPSSLQNSRSIGKKEIQDYDTLLISLKGITVKPRSLKYLA